MEQADKLAREQETLGKEITRIVTNMKKDSTSRKSEQYFDSKLETTNKILDEIKENHRKFQKLGCQDHTYNKQNYYGQLKDAYDEANKYIMESREKFLNFQQLQIDIKETQTALCQIGDILDDTKVELDQGISIARKQQLLSKISARWQEVRHMYFKLQVEDNHNSIKQAYKAMEKLQEEISLALGDSTSTATVVPKACNIALPQIKLPFFDGRYDEWTTFRDIFSKVVHDNTSLTDIEKMQYLKSHVRGEAARLIQHLKITSNNYTTSWSILDKRYTNDRLLTNKLMDRILDTPSIHYESAFKLKQLHDTVFECLEALNNLNIDTSSWGPMVSRIITRKWDAETNRLYEQSLGAPHEIQPIDELMKFIQKRFHSLETSNDSIKKETTRDNNSTCSCCKESHKLHLCPRFQSMPVTARLRIVREGSLCPNCLKHDTKNRCLSAERCRKCRKFHHTLLHEEIGYRQDQRQPNRGQQNQSYRGTQNASNSRPPPRTQNNANHCRRQDNMVVLATAMVRVSDIYGTDQLIRVLVDPGSQSTFITEEAAKILAIPRQPIQADITGVGGGEPLTAKWQITAAIRPRFASDFTLQAPCIVLPRLTRSLPTKPFNVENSQWGNVILADPTFSKPGPVDVILGAKEYGEIILEGIKKTKDGLLGQNTELGWIVSGTMTTHNGSRPHVHTMTTLIEEDKQLTKFWEIEEVPQQRHLTEDEKYCEEHYEANTVRNLNGTYTVRLPFSQKIEELGHSRQRAAARLFQLEKRLARDSELNMNYKTFMKEYEDLDHMYMVPASEETAKYYIPHQPVIKESSTTTKLRVVFDASSKTSTGISLNNTMLTGPRLQQELSDILLRWRCHRIAISSDVEKMYRQIKVHPDDQAYQTILWRYNSREKIREYRLNTLTYGTTAAPYLAIKTIQRLANDEELRFPKASKTTVLDFYVDDLLSGADTVNDAMQLQTELTDMFLAGGFVLRKWSTNSMEVLQSIPEQMRDQSMMEITEDQTKKSLGIHWAPRDDTFHFVADVSPSTKITKRIILSEVSRLFDPLGWIAPVTINAKLLIQDLWLQKIGWDDEVSENTKLKWKTFQKELKYVDKIVIPRWTNQSSGSHFELHGFCDSSEKAYGAVVYMKLIAGNTEDIKITLLTAKSKVAPAKMQATLPRLELCSALLLAKLLRRTVETLSSGNTNIYAWTDSMIALAWIKGSAKKWKTFVANRVAQINNLIPEGHWGHVRSEHNPADIISRGMEPSKLIHQSLWWQGPQWLKSNMVEQTEIEATIDAIPEQINVCHVVSSKSQVNDEIIRRFSSLTRLIRVISFCQRFVQCCKIKVKKTERLSVKELQGALEAVVKMEQQLYFPDEMTALQEKLPVGRKSHILNLNPFIDDKGVLRLGGRLEKSQLRYETKHPVILPYNCPLTKLVILDAHHNTLHGGNQLTLASTRKQFWIINGKRAVKTVISRCVKCIRFRAQTAEQLMGNLPAARVSPSHPFLHTGVDYAGPIQIKTTKGRGHKSYKGYVAIFVCLATKAIHIEVVSDMSSDTFLAAFRRFTARRGRCAHMYSDNGTNFVGASRILQKEVVQTIKMSNIEDKLASIGTQWHFIPPAAPHFGGLWEAAVKSMKYHLRRVIGATCLTYEELSTLMHQIEACLNSRPLCPLNNDPSDISHLTPGHFLVGRALVEPPDPVVTTINSNLQERWKLVQKIKMDVWRKWSSDYLHQLQQRYKWKNIKKSPEIGELVLIKDEDINPSKWPLAKIIETHPSEDNTVRVVTIKKADGSSMKRPIHKLIPLRTEHERKPIISNRRSVKLWKIAFMAVLFLVTLKNSTAQKYSLHYPPPGIYTEHVGHAKIDRGIFRLELRFDKNKLANDTQNICESIKQVEALCEKAKELASNTQCSSLIHHLKDKERQIESMDKGMKTISASRSKRGLVGKMLTSLFGVNDEVYQDIEQLETNQKGLIQASNHQTKFMLHALAEFNETENRINGHLRRFQERMNEGMKAIKEMNHWYNSVDNNVLNIYLLSTYQIVLNYIDDVIDHHQHLLDIHYHRNHLFELISPIQIENAILNISKKLPTNIQIISFPLLKTRIHHSNEFIHVFGYFIMTEVDNFLLVRATPIPLKVTNDSYWIMDVPNERLAVNYNTQLYFQLSEEEFRSCKNIEEEVYVCSPASTRTIDASPHCVIDEIYQRTENTTCPVHEINLQSMIWKQLSTPNAWLFITPAKVRMAIICDGVREDITVNYTGIIEISQGCIIKTSKNILTPKKLEVARVLDNSFYPARIGEIDTINISRHGPKEMQEEPVITASDSLDGLKKEEEEIDEELQNKEWVNLRRHVIIGSTTAFTTTTLIAFAAGAVYLLYRRYKNNKHTRRHQHSNSIENGIPLQSLHLYNEPSIAQPDN